VIGIDGIDASSHQSEVIALEHADVVIIPFTRLAALAHSCPALEQLIYRALSRELVREQRLVWVLGTLHAESRVAAFLLNLSERFGKLGYSPTHFNLRMKRQEIGSYLGLQLETVSRALSHFARGVIATVRQKTIQLIDLEALRRIAS
jgi:CRP/FNR family transcriptional regulator, anaerobic regulatory protein